MWKAENGDWTLTNMEAPLCFKCMNPGKEPVGETVETSICSPLRMEIRDSQKLEATCPTCNRTMYREVS